jgi:CRP-like cAMP-binding protein
MQSLTPLRTFPESDHLSEHKASPELTAAFSNQATELVCDEARVLFQQGESEKGVYLVRGGEVILTMPISSAHSMSFRATEGSLVGLPATFSDEPYSMTALAQSGSVFGHMDRESFLRMLVERPMLAIDVLAILAAETRSARIAIVDLGSRKRGLRRKATLFN